MYTSSFILDSYQQKQHPIRFSKIPATTSQYTSITSKHNIIIIIQFFRCLFVFLLYIIAITLNKLKGENFYLQTEATPPKNETPSPRKILQITTNKEERRNTISMNVLSVKERWNLVDYFLDDRGNLDRVKDSFIPF